MTSLSTCTSSWSRAVRMVESGGDWGECSMASASSPSVGKPVRRAAMTEAQKRIGSLSNASRESQATGGSSPPVLPLTPHRAEEAATHAERSVVFPLPAEAETSVKR